MANANAQTALINPKQMAQSMANQEYNPAINSLKQALLDVVTQGKYDQGQLHGWYGQMQNLDNSQYAAQGANQQQELQDLSQNMGNVAQLFGASNAQQMQPALGNATGLVGAESKSQMDYLQNMLPLLKAQAASGSSNLSNSVMAQQRNYNDQLTSQQQAKGAAYNANYQQALQDRATQQQNQLALQQAQALFPSQLSASKATAKADKANADAAGAYNRARINAQNAAAAHSRALSAETTSVIQKNMAEAKKASQAATAAGVKAKQGPLAPGSTSAQRIQGSLFKALMVGGKGGNPVQNPMHAQRALYAQAVSAGLINKNGKPLVPGAIKLLNATLMEMYNRDQAWQKGWQWTGRRFVPRKG